MKPIWDMIDGFQLHLKLLSLVLFLMPLP
uniref:Uncharacterized protein n=1 Tax=Medicago truncatula TaxID=3880 RepID=I3T8U2_MEDTR|nr:unknown [Medicago truncatula]